MGSLIHVESPIVSSCNNHIRPLLDVVDGLRHINIMEAGIQLPTIVVVGDQSSGKSSVLESLAGISLPRGREICTRVPLIMCLQNHQNPNPELSLVYKGKTVPTDEENVADAISLATEEIAGKEKGISNKHLTMVDLPGITRVAVGDQPEDIYEQVSNIITKFITPEESIILNVLSAGVDFSTCESIRMSQRVDKTGQRTLAVVTKADMSPDEFDEFPDAKDMHGSARLAEMLSRFSKELQSCEDFKENFLMDEIEVLEEAKSIGLPNFIKKAPFLALLQKKVKSISAKPVDFVEMIWSYVENLVIAVLLKHSDNYPQLLSGTRRAAQNLIAKKKQQSVDWVNDMVEMEKLTDFTCNPEYVATRNELMSEQDTFVKSVDKNDNEIDLDRFGVVDVVHLFNHKGVVQEAFDLKMRMTAYWEIVTRRMVDNMALHLLFSIQKLVNKEMQNEIITELVGTQGNGMERMLEEPPSIAEKRNNLKKSIKLLKESKDVVANIMDTVAHNFD